MGQIRILKAINTHDGAVVVGQVTAGRAPAEVIVDNLGASVAARVTGPIVNSDSAAARLLGLTPFVFEATLGFSKVPSPGQEMTVTAISNERQVLAQGRFPWPEVNPWKANSVRLSRAQLMEFGQVLHVNGWLAEPENVSRIELRSGHRVQLAKLGTARPDVLKNHPEVGTAYSGFEVRLNGFAPDEPAELAVFDLAGQLVFQRLVSPKPQDVFMRRRAAPHDAIAAAYSDRLLAVSASIRGLEPPLKFHLKSPDGFFASQTAACSESKKAPAALNSNRAAWVGSAVFAMDGKPEGKLELLVEDRKGAVAFNDISPSIAETSGKPKIENAYYCPETRNLVVQGSCGFLGATHVHAKVGGMPVSATRTFLKHKEDFLDAPDAGFYLASLVEMEPGELVEVEFFAGAHKLGTQSKPVRERRIPQTQVLGPSCRSSQGAAHYQFESAAQRPDAPWIIYATGMASWPVTGGGQARSYAMAKYLRRQGYRVLLVVDYSSEADETAAAYLKEFADALVFAPLGGTPPGTAPDHAMYKKSKAELGPLLETLEAGYAPRATIINFAFNLYAAENLKGPVILDAHDVQHLRAKNAQEQGASLEDRRCTKREEVALLRHASGIVAIQEEEQNILQECAPETPVIKVEHTLEVDADASAPTAGQLKKLLFIGQRYAPNIAGLQAFLDNAWPKIKKRYPDAELHVAGRVCELFKHLRDESIKLHGVVPDLKPLYDMCGIAINPTNFGTGFKIKSIEGLAYKRCVVTTQSGTLGLPSGAPLKIAKIEKFADAVSALIENPAQARELAEQGAKFLNRNFAPDQVYQPLSSLIESLPAAPQVSPASARLKGHEIIGTNLMLDLHFTGGPSGEKTRPVKIEVAAKIGPPIEIWHAVPAGLTDARLKVPLPVWFRDSTPIQTDVYIDGTEAGRLELTCGGAQNGIQLDAELVPVRSEFARQDDAGRP